MIVIRKHGTVIASFATPQEIVISHANDSIRLGDGTDLLSWVDVGGTKCIPVDVKATTGATSANQTNGTQRTKITDNTGTDHVEVDDVGGEKALKVSVISSVGGGAAPSHTDDTAYTPGTSVFTAIGGFADETAPDSVDEGDAGALRMTLDRLLKIQLAGVASGVAVPITDNSGSITVDGTFWQATQPISHANLANLDAAISTLATHAKQDTQITALQLIDDVIYVDDAAFTTATSKVAAIGANYKSTVDAVDDGDVGALHMTARRALHASLRYEATGNQIIGQQAMADSIPVALASNQSALAVTGTFWQATQPVSGTVTAVGGAAHDAAVSGNPNLIGLEARTTALGTAVAANDAVRASADEYGRQLVVGSFAPGMIGYQVPSAITNTTETTVITADANNCLDIIMFTITNNSTVDSLASLKDSTGGTTRWTGLVPKGGGIVVCPPTPMPQATKNNNWTLTMGTTATSTNFSAMFGKRPT